MPDDSKQSFPRLAYGGWTSASRTVAVMPAATISFSEHLSIFGNPEPYFPSIHHLKRLLDENELHGRGGAAFPLSQKLRGYERHIGEVVLIANGCEGEHLSHKDEMLINRHPHLVLDGLAILGSALRAKAGYVHLKASKTSLQSVVKKALAERTPLNPFKIEVSTSAPGIGYVAGAETAVISAINRQGGRPIYLPERPIVRGVKKQPTLIANVETLAHLALLARFGSRWFSSVGIAEDSGTRLLTTTLPDGSYTVVEVAAGTQFGEVFAALGVELGQVSCGLLGGYFGQMVDAEKLWSLRASQAFLKKSGFSLGAGVVALASGCPIDEIAAVLKYLAGQTSGQCGPCYLGLPELARAWTDLRPGGASSKSISRVSELCDEIVGRGACAMPDGAVLLARSSLSRFRAEMLLHQSGRCGYK
ncbi:MAG: hypothetical protein EPN30_01800, partial [Actinomycetota bacterium]